MSPYNFFVCGQKFTQFLLSNVEGDAVDQILFGMRYFEPFQGYSRSKLKVAKNRTEFWSFFSPSQILGGRPGRPSKSYTDFITPDSRHIIWKKFCEDTPTSPEVIGANMLNFKVNFKFSGLKIFFFGGGGREASVPYPRLIRPCLSLSPFCIHHCLIIISVILMVY